MQDPRKVKVIAEKVFRGRKYPKPVTILSASYKADYRLVSKDDESKYTFNVNVKPEVILPKTIDFPPLLKQFIIDETKNPHPQMELVVKSNRDKLIRKANEDEKVTVDVVMGLGKPVAPNLYKNVL